MEVKNNKIIKVVTAVFLMLIFLGVLAFAYFKYFKKDAIDIYTTAINNLYSKMDNKLETYTSLSKFQSLDETYKVDSKFKINTNIEELTQYNDLELNFSGYLDYPNEIAFLETAISKSNEEIITTILTYLGSNTYFKSEELFDKVILKGTNDIFKTISTYTDNNEIDYEKVRYVLKSLKDIVIDSLDENSFIESEEKITINNKTYNTTKYTYVLDDKNKKRTMSFIIQSIIDDEKLLSTISSFYNCSTENFKTLLESELENIEKSELELETLNISVYIQNNKSIRFEIEEQDYSLVYNTVDDYFDFIIDEEPIEIKVYKSNDDIEFSFKSDDTEILYGFVSFAEDEFRIKIFTDTEVIDMDLLIDITNIENESDSISFDITTSIGISVLSINYNIEIEGSYSLTLGEHFEPIDVSDAVDLNTLTDEELESISQKMYEILNKLGY